MDSRYEIFQSLGRNHYATVSVGRDMNVGRDVAILEFLERFRLDAVRWPSIWQQTRLLMDAKLENVVPVFDAVESRGWVVMELMRGNLKSEIAKQPLAGNLVRSILRQILPSLQSYHDHGVVHGDVKPANLMFNNDGYVKLSFSPGLELGGQIPQRDADFKYLAPELLSQQFGPVGPALDLYCLGFSAVELLKGASFDSLFKGVGRQAFDADAAWMRWHSSAEEKLPSIAALVPDAPPDLVKVVDKLLAKTAAGRYPTAGEALRDLADGPQERVALPSSSPPVDRPSLASRTVSKTSPDPMRVASAPKPLQVTTANLKPFSREWINKKLENPAIMYSVCAMILIPTIVFMFYEPGADPGQVAVKVTWEPPDATAEIDGKPIADKSGATLKLALGAHKLQLRRAGYLDTIENIEISPKIGRLGPFQLQPEKRSPASKVTKTNKSPSERKPSPPLGNPLPEGLVAKEGAPLDPALKLPIRVVAKKLPSAEARMELALTPPGEFVFGADEPLPSELSKSPRQIDQAYYIGVTEVTNSQFLEYAQSQMLQDDMPCVASARQRVAAGGQNEPALGVPFQEAENFSRWVSPDGDLPSELEWERAARGDNGRLFPWPSNEPATLALACLRADSQTPAPCAVDDLSEGNSPEGLSHLLGNAAEWCRDLYGAGAGDLDKGFPGVGQCHVIRGGSFKMPPGEGLRLTWRSNVTDSGASDVGFRVVVRTVVKRPTTSSR